MSYLGEAGQILFLYMTHQFVSLGGGILFLRKPTPV